MSPRLAPRGSSLRRPGTHASISIVAPGSQVYFTHSFVAPVTAGTVAVTDHGGPLRRHARRGHGLVFRATVDLHGGLYILVNNAGIESPGTVTETTDEQWQRLIDVNLKGQFLCARQAVPLMLARGSGSIVNNASINGIRGNHRLVAYSASKGGVVAMTMAMALDYAPRGIRVNCVCPAAIENTRMDAISAARAPDPQQRREYLLAKHPIGRLGQPEDVAYAMLFLASDE